MPNLEQKSVPSDKQIREFWEWCGFKALEYGENEDGTWEWRERLGATISLRLALDLNNLFKHAVPKLGNYNLTLRRYNNLWSFLVGEPLPTGERLVWTDKDPTLALFWVIWEVIKK